MSAFVKNTYEIFKAMLPNTILLFTLVFKTAIAVTFLEK
jgi:hypothetical protein